MKPLGDTAAPARRLPHTETLTGLPLSRGFAVGPVFLYGGAGTFTVPEYTLPPDRVGSELSRYEAARVETRRQLEKLVSDFGAQADSEGANVFANHLILLDDDTVTEPIRALIRDEALNAEAAVRRVVSGYRALFERMSDPYLRERVRDIDDLEGRMLRVLLGKADTALVHIDRPVILVADDLTPSETAALPRALILGIATNRGSTTSHVALLARALGIPAVAGLETVTAHVRPGDAMVLDGANGTVIVNPDPDTRVRYARLVTRQRAFLAILDEDRDRPCTLADGTPISVCANVQPGVPLTGLAAFGARGIGLYRSEYLWLNGDEAPTEDVQTAAYEAAVAAVHRLGPGARCVFRALDLGGDKLMRGAAPLEANPFLGNRSIRWLLTHRDDFRAQLRAILKASAHGPAAVMYPMVATVEELRAANAVLREAMEQLRMAGIAFDAAIPKGAMIEVPSAALNAGALAREVDFFSIGTNDLVQYTLAADRGNPEVAYLYQPAHPAVLRLVEMTARAGAEAHIPVSVCGESASEPALAVLWLALGVTGLSMSASYIPVVKRVLRQLTRADLDALAGQVHALLADGAAETVHACCRDFLQAHVADFAEMQAFFTGG